MGNAKVISMFSQPVNVSYLCFEIGGVLDTCDVQLGEAVNDIPYFKLTNQLKGAGTVAGDPSRLVCDSTGLLKIVDKFSLATLRNEDRKASLDSAVNSRQNIYFSKYANSASVISTIEAYYSKTSPASNANLLEILSELAQQQATDLQDAYKEDDRTGVVKTTSSSVDSSTRSQGNSLRAGKFWQESVGKFVPKGTKLPHAPPLPWEGHPAAWGGEGYKGVRFIAPGTTATAVTVGVNYEESNNSSIARGSQSATHVDYEYRTPFIETQARNLRAQISLRDQKFQMFMFEQNIPHLDQIFKNELEAVDNDVYQLQIALLRSILISPISGIVTGIYKNPGDGVGAGEPVMRVEDNGVVHLVARLVHSGPIEIGATATVTTTLGGAASPMTPIDGSVVAARGQGSGVRWEVIVKVDNIGADGAPVLPLGYVFDPEFTTVAVV